jgi:glycosyltransferase involved in cell wall biosynthesis
MTVVNAGGLDTRTRPGWCCVQAGHRERYGVPRALHHEGILDSLITDLWAPPGSPLLTLAGGRAARRMRDRYSPDLPRDKVIAFTGRTLAWELAASLRDLRSDSRIHARNAWWSALGVRALRSALLPSTGFVFDYCYEARDLFNEAHRRGLTPVLGQIDPGPVEDRKVAEIVRRWPEYRTPFMAGSSAYYDSWREECRLAGHIVVNSEWSRSALMAEGIDPGKIVVCPLVYTPPSGAAGWQRTYPGAFTRERPLRVLFLGQCILRKGIAETVGAARELAELPVEFTFVGNTDIDKLEGHFGRARIRYVPRVSREECEAFYRNADVFLFPTHSDGFGLTQLEARAWKLPIIASRFCAEVAADGKTGWLLDEVSVECIVEVLGQVLGDPAELARRSAAIVPWQFDVGRLGGMLRSLASNSPGGQVDSMGIQASRKD